MKKLICLVLVVLLALSAVSAFAEADTDKADTDAASNSVNLLGLLLGMSANATPESEPKDLKVEEKVITDTAEFEVVSLAISPIERGKPSGWMTITGPKSKEKFMVDSDCCVLTIVYRVKNTSTKSKWYWPSNLMVHVKWDEYEFEKLDAKPYGDLQCTQTDEYIAVVEIPNEIAQEGYEDLTIEIGFKESFETINDMRYADHRFILPPLSFTFDSNKNEPAADGSAEPTMEPAMVYETLQKGSKGEAVVKLQEKLIALGYLNGKADGDYGKGTAGAVEKFQSDESLPVNGIADNDTQVRLYEKEIPFRSDIKVASVRTGKTYSGALQLYIQLENIGNTTIDRVDFHVKSWNTYGELIKYKGSEYVDCYYTSEIKAGKKMPSDWYYNFSGLNDATKFAICVYRYHYKNGETVDIDLEDQVWELFG